jgi:hypothetical protein
MAQPTTSGSEIMSLLLGDNEHDEEILEVVEAVLTMDDMTVDIDQYEIHDPLQNEDGEHVPESFEFIGSQGPTLSQTVMAQAEEEVELTSADAPKEYIEFELASVNPLDEVAEPVHTGKGGLYSPTVTTPNDDDLLGEVGPATNGFTPDLPDLPDEDEVPTGPLTQASFSEPTVAPRPVVSHEPVAALPTVMNTEEAALPPINPMQGSPAATPDLPDLPDVLEVELEEPPTSVPESDESATEDENRIWPWPKADPWSPTQVYQEVVAAMEHIKHGRMQQAANTLDHLGPHLDLNLDMLLHISVLMQHLGRHDHVKWTLDMAAFVHPYDPHVQQARTQLLA